MRLLSNLFSFAALATFSTLVTLTGCGVDEVMKATTSMPKKMDTMVEGMNTTNEAVRLQKLGIAIQNLFAKENTEYQRPPLRMMTWGKLVAETATVDELLQLTELWTSEIQDTTPNDFENDAEKSSLDNQKLARKNAILITAGFVPQKTIERIVAEQLINADGSMTEAANQLVAARAIFLKDIYIGSLLMKEGRKLDNFKKIEEVVAVAEKIDYVVTLPENVRANLRFKVRGFSVNREDNANTLISADLNQKTWVNLHEALVNDLSPAFKVQPMSEDTVSKQDKAKFEQYEALRLKIESKIKK